MKWFNSRVWMMWNELQYFSQWHGRSCCESSSLCANICRPDSHFNLSTENLFSNLWTTTFFILSCCFLTCLLCLLLVCTWAKKQHQKGLMLTKLVTQRNSHCLYRCEHINNCIWSQTTWFVKPIQANLCNKLIARF